MKTQFNVWIIAGGIGAALIAFLLFLAAIQPQRGIQPLETAQLIVIPGPTETRIVVPEINPMPTMTPAQVFVTPGADGAIQVGAYVQISGTDGEGLRLRTAPGTENPPRFLGMDSEVFKVIGGPEEKGGYTWWHLEAPYDQNRNGWAVSNYLTVVAVNP